MVASGANDTSSFCVFLYKGSVFCFWEGEVGTYFGICYLSDKKQTFLTRL